MALDLIISKVLPIPDYKTLCYLALTLCQLPLYPHKNLSAPPEGPRGPKAYP